jgi:hypothetical protein
VRVCVWVCVVCVRVCVGGCVCAFVCVLLYVCVVCGGGERDGRVTCIVLVLAAPLLLVSLLLLVWLDVRLDVVAVGLEQNTAI